MKCTKTNAYCNAQKKKKKNANEDERRLAYNVSHVDPIEARDFVSDRADSNL